MIRRSSGSRDGPSKVSVVNSASGGYQQNARRRFSLPKISAFRIVAALIAIVLVTAFTLPFLSSLQEVSYTDSDFISFRSGSEGEAYPCIDNAARVRESQRVLESVRRDLLQSARQLEKTNAEFEDVEKRLTEKRSELTALQIEIETLKLLQKELQDKKNVPVLLPLAPPHRSRALDLRVPNGLLFETAFDFSRCSIAGGFQFFVYKLQSNGSETALRFFRSLQRWKENTGSPDAACLFFVITSGSTKLSSLEFWRKGTNHVVINLGSVSVTEPGNAVVISPTFGLGTYRKDFDLPLYLDVPDYDENEWQRLPALLPYSRKYLISYEGLLDERFEAQLNGIAVSAEAASDAVYFSTNCSSHLYSVCRNSSERGVLLQNSMFVLIFESPAEDSSRQFNLRLLEALKSGSVPVVISLRAVLPFADVLDWGRALLQIAPLRLPELHFILRSVSAADILEMRRNGRFLLENYFANVEVLARGIIAFLRRKVGVPGGFRQAPPAKPLFNGSFVAAKTSLVPTPQFEEEYLGPPEAPHKSPSYSHNFTSLHKYSYYLWNEMGFGLGGSPEYLPVEPAYPSEFEFDEGVAFGFRPIAPGSGGEFSAAIGGNRPREQFTVVLLTYRRDSVLCSALERLNNMPYLNKVLVLWNDDALPMDRKWPRLHVPVIFIKTEKNSLNNRFIPYAEIETEAVLSLDDDIDLKQHEIIFAFRVWREQRTKIVGFPARYHARYNDEMYYNSNHTCQLSMILTGAAFLHKWYMYMYTFQMPSVIRQKVDELMNCEDLAMNFLVSHLTREPPIKTTSKWTIRCPQCSEMLSQDESHFTERHGCIRFFTRVYGYNPLLFSQFRADSILFKTKLPREHTKCFRYV